MALRALILAAGAAVDDLILGIPLHPVPAKTVLETDLSPVHSLLTRCRDVMTQLGNFLSE